MWEFNVENLVAIRGNLVIGDHPNSLTSSTGTSPWNKPNGWIEAECVIGCDEIPGHNCACGLYGYLSVSACMNMVLGFTLVLLVEAFGKTLIGEYDLIKMEACQVIAIVNWDANLRPMNNTSFAATFFNLPIVDLDFAKMLINQQKEKWLT